MIEFLIQTDIKLFLYLNSFHNSFFDEIMWFFSGKISWLPLYLAVIYFVFKKFGTKTGFLLLLMFFAVILLSDQTSVHFFKFQFKRLRPCFNPEISDLVHVVKYPGGKYGFVSSHAANAFGFSVFSALIFKNKVFSVFILLWTVILSYSRIYLGVHYPADVFGGALLGTFWAFVIYKIFLYTEKRKIAKAQNSKQLP